MTVWSKSLASRSLLATNHQTELGVSFKHLDSIHDMHSSRLQRLCPHDVTLFIETSCCKLWEENTPKLCILPFNSTSTVTSISFCAASSKCATIGLLDPTRYKVTFFTFLGEKKKTNMHFHPKPWLPQQWDREQPERKKTQPDWNWQGKNEFWTSKNNI